MKRRELIAGVMERRVIRGACAKTTPSYHGFRLLLHGQGGA
jgi:hypothetical protein